MAVTAHRGIDNAKEVTVSEGTRQMSRPCNHEVRTFSQEFDELALQKKQIEVNLGKYSKTALLKEQMKIRRMGGDTLRLWIERKSKLEDERRSLIEEKNQIETRMMFIKEKVIEETRKRKAVPQVDPRKDYFEQMIAELRAIRALLEAKQ